MLNVRHVAVIGILLCAYGFERASAHLLPLASIGLISFCAVAQFAPALLIGMFWRRAHRYGVIAGLLGGCMIWACLLLFPLFGGPHDWLVRFGDLIREAVSGVLGPLDSLSQAVFASLSVNISLLVAVSYFARRAVRDITQADAFVGGERATDMIESDLPTAKEIRALVARFVGEERAQQAFAEAPKDPAELLVFAERLLSGAIGAASAHIMVRSDRLALNLSRREARAMLGEASAAILQNAELLRSTLDSVSQGIAVFDENRGLAVWNDQFLTLAGLSRQNARAGEPIAALSAEAGFVLDDPAQPSQRLAARQRADADGQPRCHAQRRHGDHPARCQRRRARRRSDPRQRAAHPHLHRQCAGADRLYRSRRALPVHQPALSEGAESFFGGSEGRSLIEVLGVERYDELKLHIDAVLRGEPQSFEISFPTNNQRIEIARGTYIPHFDERGEVLGFFLLYQDITEPRRAEQELRQAKDRLEERVQERTGELARLVQQLVGCAPAGRGGQPEQDPLPRRRQPRSAAALACGAAVLGGAAGAAADRRHRRQGGSQPGRGRGDPGRVAGYRQAGCRRGEAEPGRGAARTAAGVAARFFCVHRRAGWGGTAPRADLAAIPSDPQLLRRVLQNLVANAVRYAPSIDGRKAKVLVGCRRRQGQAVLEVWDNGPGIPADKQPLIFKEFVRLPQNLPATQERGLGLGLAIVDRIARMLGHGVTVHSEPGRGSRFSVAMPIARERGAGTPRRERVAIRQPAALSVLVIDNEASVQDGMRTLLQGWGCRVVGAASLPEALSVLVARVWRRTWRWWICNWMTGSTALPWWRRCGPRSAPICRQR